MLFVSGYSGSLRIPLRRFLQKPMPLRAFRAPHFLKSRSSEHFKVNILVFRVVFSDQLLESVNFQSQSQQEHAAVAVQLHSQCFSLPFCIVVIVVGMAALVEADVAAWMESVQATATGTVSEAAVTICSCSVEVRE